WKTWRRRGSRAAPARRCIKRPAPRPPPPRRRAACAAPGGTPGRDTAAPGGRTLRRFPGEPPPAAPPRRSPSGASPSSRTSAYPPFGRRPRAKGFTGGRFSQKNSRGIQEGPRVRLTGGGAVRQAAGFLDPSRVFAEAQGPGQKAQRPKAPLDALPHDLRLDRKSVV